MTEELSTPALSEQEANALVLRKVVALRRLTKAAQELEEISQEVRNVRALEVCNAEVNETLEQALSTATYLEPPRQ